MISFVRPLVALLADPPEPFSPKCRLAGAASTITTPTATSASDTYTVARTSHRHAAPTSLHFGLTGSRGSTSNATSGRTKLISGGLELFAQRPLQGYGSGSFQTEYQRHSKTSVENAMAASHTIPVTVAAEQGLIGLALYLALLSAAFAVLFTGAGRSPPRIAISACFAALVLHTWTYADFLEDPLTWTLLGIGIALARAGGQPPLDGRLRAHTRAPLARAGGQ